jgi:hypothetical protein
MISPELSQALFFDTLKSYAKEKKSLPREPELEDPRSQYISLYQLYPDSIWHSPERVRIGNYWYKERQESKLIFFNREEPIIPFEENEDRVAINEVIICPNNEQAKRRILTGEAVLKVDAVVFPGIDVRQASSHWRFLTRLYNKAFFAQNPEDIKQGCRLWVADFGDQSQSWDDLEFNSYNDIGFIRSFEKAISECSRLLKLQDSEKPPLLLHSFSAIMFWHLLMARAREFADAISNIPEATDYARRAFQPFGLAYRDDRCLQYASPLKRDLDFFKSLKEFRQIELLNPTLLMWLARGPHFRAGIHVMAKKLPPDVLLTSAITKPTALGTLAKASQPFHIETRNQARQKLHQMRLGFSERNQALKQSTIIFERVFKNWFKRLKRRAEAQDNYFLVEDLVAVLQANLPRINLWLGDKDIICDSSRVKEFLTSQWWRENYFGALPSIAHILTMFGATHTNIFLE